MSGIAYSSQVPSVVIQRVLSLAWSSPLTTADRITLMTSSTLVNKDWATIFAIISHRDVYLPTTSYFVQKLLPILTGQAKSEPDLKMTCRSINMVLEHTTAFTVPALPNIALTVPTAISVPGCADEPLMGHTLRALLSALSENEHALPNLRAIALEFADMRRDDDVFVNDRFFRFPSQVTDLTLSFTHNPLVPPAHVTGVRASQARHDFARPTGVAARVDQRLHGGEVHACFPAVRRLRILGGSEGAIADAVAQCPALEILELDISGTPRPSILSTHLVSLCTPAAVVRLGGETPFLPVLAIKSGLCDTAPDVWYGFDVDAATGLRGFRRTAPVPVVVRRRRTSRFMAKAAKPFSRLFSSSVLKEKTNSSH